MEDMEAIAAMMPDEILPPYYKSRSYINSGLAINEVGKTDYPNYIRPSIG